MTRALWPRQRPLSDLPFFGCMIALASVYVVLILSMLAADAGFVSFADLREALATREIRYSIALSLLSCTLSTLLSLWFAVPVAYLMAQRRFPGQRLLDAVLDIPIVLPPLVIGLSLLILFQRTAAGRWVESIVPLTFEVPGVVLGQFTVACAFAVRTLRSTFAQLDPRAEQVALTLGCSRAQAFFWVVLPEARGGLVTAATLAWARAFGEFGPILVFAGATRMRTEVLPTTVFLELSVGDLEKALAVSMLMVGAAVVVLLGARALGMQREWF